MAENPPKARFPFTCDDELYEQLRERAHAERRSMVEIVREATQAALAKKRSAA